MRVNEERFLISCGKFAQSRDLLQILTEVKSGIDSVRWPKGSSNFTIKPSRKGNGVVPIKEACITHLESCGWNPEYRLKLAAREKPGPLDAVKTLSDGRFFAFEWETGNISSTHRALNKMAVGLLEGILAGGIVVLPTRKLYRYLTDRIGNFEEIVPYFPMWEKLPVKDGVLAIFSIEHDSESSRVSLIRKGTDGRALV